MQKNDLCSNPSRHKVCILARIFMGNRQTPKKIAKMKTLNKIKHFSYPKQVRSTEIRRATTILVSIEFFLP